MLRRPTIATRTDTLFPYTTRFRSKVALRVAGRINRGDGQVKNLGSGRDFQNQHDNSFRASLLIEPTHWLKNLTIFDYFDLPLSKNGGAAQVVVATGIPAFQPFVAAQKALGPHRIDGGDLDNRSAKRRGGKECVSTCRSRGEA